MNVATDGESSDAAVVSSDFRGRLSCCDKNGLDEHLVIMGDCQMSSMVGLSCGLQHKKNSNQVQ
jgi:hypothetical protein